MTTAFEGDVGLVALAGDRQLVSGGERPRFPARLLITEQDLFEAVRSGGTADVAAARRAMIDQLQAQLASDRSRLAALSERSDYEERARLLPRVAVMQRRLEDLTGDDAPAARATLAPVSPAPPAPVAPAAPLTPTPAPPPVLARPQVADSGPRARGTRHRNDIQGLRAVAVLLVALAHAGVGVLKGGYVGVDVFFVLSGFLITGLLVDEARRHHVVSLSDFYLRRARRILPAATLTLIATDFAAYHLLNFVRAKQYLEDSLASAIFTANIHFAAQGTDYFAQGQPPSPLQHFWSLSVEEQFYVVWPALFALALGILFRRRHSRRPRPPAAGGRLRVEIAVSAITVASLVWSIHETAVHPTSAYFSTFARAWELGLGAALAVGASRIGAIRDGWRTAMGWIGLGAIAAAAVLFSSSTPFPGYAALLPTVGAVLLIAAGMTPGASRRSAGRLLSLAPLRYIGDRSYAFYLWHWPVLIIVAQHEGHNLSVGTNLLLLLGAFGLSVISYALVEKPIRSARWARRPAAFPAFVVCLIAVLALASTYISTINNHEAELTAQADTQAPAVLALASGGRPAGVGQAEGGVSLLVPAVAKEVTHPPQQGKLPAVLLPSLGHLADDVPQIPPSCMAHQGQTQSQICRWGSSTGTRTLVAIGDSHTEMWVPDLLSLAHSDGWTVVTLLKSGCSPPLWQGSLGPADCHAWFRWVLGEVARLHPAATLVGGFYNHLSTGPDQQTLAGLHAAVLGARRVSPRVIVLGDVPDRTRQPIDCLLAPHATAAGCSDALTQPESSLAVLVAQEAAADGAAFIDPTGWFCYQGQCPLVVGNVITYRDAGHVSQTYAQALIGAFRTSFRLALKAAPKHG